MQDGFEFTTFFWMLKDDLSECSSVEFARSGDHIIAKAVP